MVVVCPGVSQASIDAITAKPRNIEKALVEDGVPYVKASDVIAGGTLWINDEPRVVAGIFETAPKIGVVWMLASCDVKPYLRKLIPAMRRGIAQAEARGYQLVAAVQPQFPEAGVFMEHFGFERSNIVVAKGHAVYLKRK